MNLFMALADSPDLLNISRLVIRSYVSKVSSSLLNSSQSLRNGMRLIRSANGRL